MVLYENLTARVCIHDSVSNDLLIMRFGFAFLDIKLIKKSFLQFADCFYNKEIPIWKFKLYTRKMLFLKVALVQSFIMPPQPKSNQSLILVKTPNLLDHIATYSM